MSNKRKELERHVIGINKHLRYAVGNMSLIILLRNAHPIYRGDYARELYREGSITKEEAKEFIKI